VTFKIDRTPGESCTTIKIIGRITAEDVGELKAEVDAGGGSVVVDLGEMSLVSVEVIRFLSACESRGVRLLNCSAWIRKWIDSEVKGRQ